MIKHASLHVSVYNIKFVCVCVCVGGGRGGVEEGVRAASGAGVLRCGPREALSHRDRDHRARTMFKVHISQRYRRRLGAPTTKRRYAIT